MSRLEIDKIAEQLYEASMSTNPVKPLTETYPEITIGEAYAVQMCNVKRALESGLKMTGKKIGLTSKVMQNMFGVNEPDYGHLFDDMEVTGRKISSCTMIQPRVEAEIAFVMGRDLNFDREITVDDVLACTDYVVASLEIVDSRIEGWRIKLFDTVADNASSGRYVLGEKRFKVSEVDLKEVTMDFYMNGEKKNSGRGTDVLGDPAYCVAWLANKMMEYGTRIRKGEVVLSGALSAAIPAKQGDRFRAEFSTLGAVEVMFV